jgi:ribosomal protein L36
MCKYGLLLDYAGDVVGFEFAVVGALIAANMCVEKLVKRRGVIMVACMAELVQKDKLAQVLG